MDFIDLINNLEESILTRTVIDCKKYDKTTIAYTGKDEFKVILNEETEYTDIRQIILNDNGEIVNIMLQNHYLKYHDIDLSDITSIGVENAT